MFTHLLLPLDGSELAELALPMALELARRFDATLTLLRIVQPPHLVTTNYEMATVYASLREEMWQDAEAYLTEKVAAARADGVTANGRVLEDTNVADAILDVVEELAVDGLVMSTHGRGGVRRWVYGSVADKVLQRAEVPILLVRVLSPRLDEPLALDVPEITSFEAMHSHETA